MISIKRIDVSKTYPLRIQVLRNGIAENYHFEGDDLNVSFHLGAYDNDQCIGIATFLKNTQKLLSGNNLYQLRGMAVLPEYQHKGIGKKIIDWSEKILKSKNCDLLWCNAREKAVGFYKNKGFIIIGDPFNIPKIGLHYVMYKEL